MFSLSLRGDGVVWLKTQGVSKYTISKVFGTQKKVKYLHKSKYCTGNKTNFNFDNNLFYA